MAQVFRRSLSLPGSRAESSHRLDAWSCRFFASFHQAVGPCFCFRLQFVTGFTEPIALTPIGLRTLLSVTAQYGCRCAGGHKAHSQRIHAAVGTALPVRQQTDKCRQQQSTAAATSTVERGANSTGRPAQASTGGIQVITMHYRHSHTVLFAGAVFIPSTLAHTPLHTPVQHVPLSHAPSF
jgi:hypothetical protein